MEFLRVARLPIASGAYARIVGLTGRTELNGVDVEIISPIPCGAELQAPERRWLVCLVCPHDGKSHKLKVRARNLLVVGGWPSLDDEMPRVPDPPEAWRECRSEERTALLHAAAQPFQLHRLCGLDLSADAGRLCAKHVELISTACIHIRWLVLDSCTNAVDDQSLPLLAEPPALTWLSVRACRRVSDAGVRALADGFDLMPKEPREVVRSERSRGPLAALGAAIGGARRPLRLQTIRLNGCSLVTDASGSSLGTGCTSLTTVCLSALPLLGDRGLCELARHATLTAVELDACPSVSDTGISTLARLCPLRSLSLRGQMLSRRGLASCGATEVEVRHNTISSRDAMSTRNVNLSGGATSPGDVVPDGALALSDFSLRALAEYRGASLTALDVSASRWLSDGAVQAISSHCVYLRLLFFACCPKLTEAALHAAAAAPSIACIDAYGCPAMKEATLRAVMEAKPNLEIRCV